MTSRFDPAEQAQWPRLVGRALPHLARLPRVVPALLLLIWLLPPLVPPETGLRFGRGFQIFFTVCLALSTLFFWFLALERIPQPTSGPGVFASVAAVYLTTVGLLVGLGAAAPQFELPGATQEGASVGAAGRGAVLFAKPEIGCFLCHSILGRGGTRGPDLTDVAARAGHRVPGLSAEKYLGEKIKSGAAYQIQVPGYSPIMPPFEQRLSDDQIADLIAYLLSPK